MNQFQHFEITAVRQGPKVAGGELHFKLSWRGMLRGLVYGNDITVPESEIDETRKLLTQNADEIWQGLTANTTH
jgi:hypothetical protein